MTDLKIAVIGAGMIGRRHIEMVRGSGQCSLCAIVDPSPEAARLAERLAVTHFETLGDLLGKRAPDGVIVATPNRLHAEQGLQCIAAGVPALIEKPVTDTLDQGRELVRAAKAANVKVLVGHHRNHSAIMAKAAEIVASGVLGRIVAVAGTTLYYKDETDGYFDGPNAWRREPGGGPILINLIHAIGDLRGLVGEIVEVHALASNRTRGFAVEDTAAISLRFADGALGTFLLSDTAASDHSWEHTSGEDMAIFGAAQSDDADCYLISGTMGTLGIPTMRLRHYGSPAERSWRKPMRKSTIAVEAADPLERQIANFCAVIRGEAEPVVSLRDGVANLAVVDAVGRSVRSGEIIRV